VCGIGTYANYNDTEYFLALNVTSLLPTITLRQSIPADRQQWAKLRNCGWVATPIHSFLLSVRNC